MANCAPSSPGASDAPMTATPQPFLSVVVPTFNRRDSLRRTLDGLAR